MNTRLQQSCYRNQGGSENELRGDLCESYIHGGNEAEAFANVANKGRDGATKSRISQPKDERLFQKDRLKS